MCDWCASPDETYPITLRGDETNLLCEYCYNQAVFPDESLDGWDLSGDDTWVEN